MTQLTCCSVLTTPSLHHIPLLHKQQTKATMASPLHDRPINNADRPIKKLVIGSKKLPTEEDTNDILRLLQHTHANVTHLKTVLHRDGTTISSGASTNDSLTNLMFLKKGKPLMSITFESHFLATNPVPMEIDTLTDYPLFDTEETLEFKAHLENPTRVELNRATLKKLKANLQEQEHRARIQTIYTLIDSLESRTKSQSTHHITNWNPFNIPLNAIKHNQIVCSHCAVTHNVYTTANPVDSFNHPAWRVCKSIQGDPHITTNGQILYCPKCISKLDQEANAVPHTNNLLPVMWAPPKLTRKSYQPMFIGGNTGSNCSPYKDNPDWMEYIVEEHELRHHYYTTNQMRGSIIRADNATNAILRQGRN